MGLTFGGTTIHIEGISPAQRPHKTKQTIGKRVTQHDIIGADSNDNVLEVKGYLTGATKALLQTERNALEDLNDGAKHAYGNTQDTRYDGNYVIETGSLSFDTHINPTFIRFSMRLVEW